MTKEGRQHIGWWKKRKWWKGRAHAH